MSAQRVLIVGGGMAGLRLCEEIAERDPHGGLAVQLIGSEPELPYNRILLTDVLAGQLSYHDIVMVDPDSYRGFTMRLGTSIEAIDRAARVIRTADGGELPYDVLVLATGADPIFPPIQGMRTDDGMLRPGVFAFRTLDDCRSLEAARKVARRAVVVGGGVLGLETARGLASYGIPVTIVHAAPHLMERQLDDAAARILQRAYRDLGVTAYVNAGVTAMTWGEEGEVDGVVLSDGRRLPAELVVISCGIRPRVSLAKECGLRVEKGIVVGDDLRTSDPYIYAIGDCAQHRNLTAGLLDPAWAQARVLAARITGTDPAADYAGFPAVTRLKASDVELTAMGRLDPGEDGEVVLFSDPGRRTYKKLIISEGRLVGAILLGDDDVSGTVTQYFDRGSPVPDDPKFLLFAGLRAEAQEELDDDATLCRCNLVSKKEVAEAFAQGARDPDMVSQITRSGTGCGSCRSDIARTLQALERAAVESAGDPS